MRLKAIKGNTVVIESIYEKIHKYNEEAPNRLDFDSIEEELEEVYSMLDSLEQENEQLKQQIESMKICGNCENNLEDGYCNSENECNWKLKE
jgi:predicted RNase H-like nuclease (RuvC/YqgF family)